MGVVPIEHKEILINDFAIRSFRDTADSDYIVARMAYRTKQVSPFLWNSLHALEKYTKCILVLNRIDSRDLGHDLARAITRLDNLKFRVRLSEGTRAFVKYLDGQAQYRYGEACTHTAGPELMRLDLAVWELRRYAHSIDYEVQMPDRRLSALESELRAIEAAEDQPHRYRLIGGQLEKIINDAKHPAREPLLWQNAWFGKKHRRNVRLAVYLYATNSPLSLHPEILDDVRKFAFVPKEAVEAYTIRS